MPSPLAPPRPRIQCRCLWDGERCPNDATQEDGLCDWCGVRWHGTGLSQRHQNFARHPHACWLPASGRTLVDDRRAS